MGQHTYFYVLSEAGPDGAPLIVLPLRTTPRARWSLRPHGPQSFSTMWTSHCHPIVADGVKDVGPLVAARALVAPVSEIADAIVRKDERFLRRLPGIGPQKCRNIIAQLEGKVAKYALLPRAEPPLAPAAHGDGAPDVAAIVREVLVRQLGLKSGEADQAIRDALARRPDLDSPEGLFEEIYRARRGTA